MEKDAILMGSVKKPGTPEPFSGFWKQATFAWLATTFRRGYTQVLSVEDLPDLDPKLDSGIIGRELAKTWAETSMSNDSIFSALLCHEGLMNIIADADNV